MKALRFAGYALLFALISLVATLTLVVHNQGKIAEIALTRIESRTGLAIRIAGTRMGFGTHLVVVLEQPRVAANGVEVATLDDIRAVLSYRAIFLHSGLPLARLVLERPRARIPAPSLSVTDGNLAHLGVQAVATLKWALDALSDTALQVEVVDALLADQNDRVLVDHFDLRSHRRHLHRPGNWPWLVDFDLALDHTPLAGLRLTGVLTLGAQPSHPNLAATGQLWFWGLDLKHVDLWVAKVSAGVVGTMAAALDNTGDVHGRAEVSLSALRAEGMPRSPDLKFGDYVATTSFNAAPDLLNLTAISLHHGGSPVPLTGTIAVQNPFAADRALSFDLAGASIDLGRIRDFIRKAQGISPQLGALAGAFEGGQLVLTRAALATTEPLRQWTFATLRDHLSFDAAIGHASCRMPEKLLVPSLTDLAAQLHYSSGVLNVEQGSAIAGGSELTELSAEANLQKAPAEVRYKLRLKADLDLAELYSSAAHTLGQASPAIALGVAKLEGRLPLVADASGNLRNWAWQPPRSYRMTVAPREVVVTLSQAPVPIGLRDGAIAATPGLISLDHVRVAPVGKDAGDAIISGTMEPGSATPLVNNVTVEMRRIKVEQWLPLVVSREVLAADGPVSGLLTANSAPRKELPVVTGKLTLTTGHLELGFLRSPITIGTATLALDGKGFSLDAPGGILEEAPLDLRLAMADFAHPVLQLDASASRLDLEVMKFIRLPWSPHSPPHFFAVPVFGHIEARTANFDKLPMTEVATDFHRDAATWQVENFTARIFEGTLNLRISGRTGPDNWIHMIGKIAEMDAGPPFLLPDKTREPPMTGKLFLDGDLWANTDVDFFDTLSGTLAIQGRDGVLNRFTLLTRVLGLIDLKSWLTANFPDPRIAGLPFKSLNADLKGKDGDFYTDNLLLDGPVMNIRAKGHVRFGDGNVDLEVGLFPFNTVNWIVHQIPLVGTNLAEGSEGLIAAYFHVHGPFRDPSVAPKPITSVAEFVKKMLGLPVNIISPNTIR